jgi:hypothetical protein
LDAFYVTASPRKHANNGILMLRIYFLMLQYQLSDVPGRTKLASRKVSAMEPRNRPYLPSPSEGALLLLLLAESKDEELSREKPNLKKITRFRVSEATLTRVLGRARLSSGFLEEVQEWLLVAGWALIFTGTTYALIKVTAVEGWTRLASKRVAAELESVKKGTFDFASHQHLLSSLNSNGDDDESGDKDSDGE